MSCVLSLVATAVGCHVLSCDNTSKFPFHVDKLVDSERLSSCHSGHGRKVGSPLNFGGGGGGGGGVYMMR